jgi:hypothetical protein
MDTVFLNLMVVIVIILAARYGFSNSYIHYSLQSETLLSYGYYGKHEK